MGVVGIALVTYGVVVPTARMALFSYAITAAIADVGLTWAFFVK